MYAISVETGKFVWKSQFVTITSKCNHFLDFRYATWTISFDSKLIVGVMLCISGSTFTTASAFDIDTGDRVWNTTLDTSYTESPLLMSDIVVDSTGTQTLYNADQNVGAYLHVGVGTDINQDVVQPYLIKLDPQTGDSKATMLGTSQFRDWSGFQMKMAGPLLTSDSFIVVTNSDWEHTNIQALSNSGTSALWNTTLTNCTSGMIYGYYFAVHEKSDNVYFACDRKAVALSASTGEEKWTVRANDVTVTVLGCSSSQLCQFSEHPSTNWKSSLWPNERYVHHS